MTELTPLPQTAIEVNQVSLAYQSDQPPELAAVDLTVREGDFISLVGPSGCGKSTLLRLIAGVLTPTSGSITVFGERQIAGWSQLSFVPQEASLLPWRNVLANVRLPLELGPRADEAAMDQKAYAALDLVNLTGVADKYPHQLSGGMRQRVALARALVGQARLLLLDEPFAALDDISRNQLHLELLRIQRRTGITVLMVTHNIFEAVFLSQAVVVMGEKPGRILGSVAIDLPAQRTLKLLGTPAFGSLVGAVQELLEQGWSDYHGNGR
ncbi:NitT/TauT family transport system ATP-binding protein [Hydrogenispora ethanolica]|jgi:NitT/TauT family transport system ATP-binding protein|uniref:NitT/TauT family transport system ATP-binding protein n=1 Tax=Hydrogenispora ethanolica TaxID=1082276 RepID=A0A4R1RMI7_HYDET|nr:ABC transporter ATP-binding protein [Hydrogenispora ethanolica]TCL67404.1 NitT/TauT family transport system ATP-binding protein [Hydrogenispora ethanolica]